MLDIYSVNKQINEIEQNVAKLQEKANLESVKKEILDLTNLSNLPNFWEDPKNANEIIQKLNSKKEIIQDFSEFNLQVSNLKEEIELYQLENDEQLEKEIEQDFETLTTRYTEFEIKTLLNDKYDSNNAILTIHSGAGGTEACDWADMLYHMYVKFAQREKFQVRIMDSEDGDVVGYKSISILIKGKNAYGKLKSEHGVHRLVRISPFDANKKRHTSFASVEVMPEIDEKIDLKINPEDLRIDTYRASGAGGQHINKTSSAVRITHIPTGIVVSCQSERSQLNNRESAMKMLYSKLMRLEELKKEQNRKDIKGEELEIAWGSQIRSYVFCPYTLVKDTRTKYEEHNVESVMNGNIDKFIFEYLKYIS